MAIVSYTLKELKKLKDETDWARVSAMRDEDIDYSDAPDVTEMLARGEAKVLGRGPVSKLIGRPRAKVTKQHQNLRLDPDIIEGFKRGGRGWQTRINDALRAHLHSIGVL